MRCRLFRCTNRRGITHCLHEILHVNAVPRNRFVSVNGSTKDVRTRNRATHIISQIQEFVFSRNCIHTLHISNIRSCTIITRCHSWIWLFFVIFQITCIFCWTLIDSLEISVKSDRYAFPPMRWLVTKHCTYTFKKNIAH